MSAVQYKHYQRKRITCCMPPTEPKTSVNQIHTHLNKADLILLLISASFIASKYCWNREVEIALQRHKDGNVWVLPIILRPVYWQGTPLGQLQALPTGAKPVTRWNDPDDAFEDVVLGIRKVVGDFYV